jgi:hypothetical protein
LGELALLGYAEGGLDEVRYAGDGEGEIGEAWGDAGDEGGGERQAIHKSEGVVLGFSETVAVVVGEEFCFVGGDVDVDGALALAGFAGEAEVEGFADGVVLPICGLTLGPQDFAFEKLP